MTLPRRPAEDPAWARYPETRLEFFREPSDARPALAIDLRAPVAADAVRALAELGLDGPFAVVTAAAPGGEPQDDAFDRARQAELDEVARTRSSVARRVDGVSPDSAHRERSVAVRTTRDEAVELGRRYGQSAIFWFDGAGFWLLGAVVAAAPVRLPA